MEGFDLHFSPLWGRKIMEWPSRPAILMHQYSRFPFTVLRTATGKRGIFPRTKKVSTGHFFTFASLRPSFQIPRPISKESPPLWGGLSLLKTNPNFNTTAPPFEIRGCNFLSGGCIFDLGGAFRSICPLDVSCTNPSTTFFLQNHLPFYQFWRHNEFLAKRLFCKICRNS